MMLKAVRAQPFVLTAEPSASKLRQWQSAIFATFGSLEMRIRDDLYFSGSIRRVQFSGLELTDVRSSSECARRTRRHASSDSAGAVALLLIRNGNIQLEQYDRRSMLGAGTFTLLDLNEPYEWVHARPAHVIGIKLPRNAVAERLGDFSPFVGSTRQAATGLGRVTADFMESFADQAEHIDERSGPALIRQFLELTELLLTVRERETELSSMTPAEAIYWRALAFIDRHLRDSDLAPADVAQAMPVSLRYLHSIFRSFGASVCETILSRRLEFCHKSLAADPQSRVSQIAHGAGFRSHAHFSTAFKAKYGFNPRDLKRLSPRPSGEAT
jgi:AraC family transcriptional regulator, positive regulator of tynA and feaB